MDDQIWKEFPKDLLEEVIARLPVDAIYRLRLVCRKWNSLLESHSFLQRCAPQNKPWVYCKTYTYIKDKTGVLYNLCRKKWRCHPICTRFMVPSASAGGLVCCIDTRCKSFFVGNPVTDTWKEFSRGRLPYYNAAMGMVIYPGGYKVVAVTHQGNFKVYDSLATNGPNTVSTIPANTKMKMCSDPCWKDQFCAPAVTIGTVVYMMISNPNGVLSYDVASGVWEVLHVPDPPESTDLALTSCGGRVLLMGLVMDKNAASIAVCVWELFRTSMMPAAWTEVDRMPRSWCWDLRSRRDVCLRCIGNTGLLMMRLWTGRVDRVFTYDVVSREWSKVRCFVIPGHKLLLCPRGGIAFFPCLSAVP